MARADQAYAARAGIFARLERQVDPLGTLPSADRSELVQAAALALPARLCPAKVRKRQRRTSD